MWRFIGILIGLAGLVMCSNSAPNNQKTSTGSDELTKETFASAAKNYKTYCASCHGETVDMFVERDWKHGKTKTDIVKAITNGYPDNGMPAWSATLKPKDITDLADFILKAIERAKRYDFDKKPKDNIYTHASMSVKLDTIASGISNPWGMAFLPDGDILFTDRGGKMYRIGKNGQKTEVAGVPKVLAQGQGGLLDVELHPKFADNNWLYLSYSKVIDSAGGTWSTTGIMRAKLNGTQLSEQQDIFVAQPYSKARHHYGSRLEFDRNGYLFFSVGDRGNHFRLPQRLDNDCGKVHRIHDDGRIPADNPFVGRDTARASIWSYGHRNPQGLALHPSTGELWEHEHGPRGGDEVNIPKKGKNYGWPTISYGINYDGSVLTPLTAMEGMEQPLTYWVPSIGPCGMTFVTGDRYKAWKGDLLVGSLRFQYLNRCKIVNDKVVNEEILLKGIGRLRCVEVGRDGYIYVAVEEPGYIFRLIPIVK